MDADLLINALGGDETVARNLERSVYVVKKWRRERGVPRDIRVRHGLADLARANERGDIAAQLIDPNCDFPPARRNHDDPTPSPKGSPS